MKITNQMIADLDLKHRPKNEFETELAKRISERLRGSDV